MKHALTVNATMLRSWTKKNCSHCNGEFKLGDKVVIDKPDYGNARKRKKLHEACYDKMYY